MDETNVADQCHWAVSMVQLFVIVKCAFFRATHSLLPTMQCRAVQRGAFKRRRNDGRIWMVNIRTWSTLDTICWWRKMSMESLTVGARITPPPTNMGHGEWTVVDLKQRDQGTPNKLHFIMFFFNFHFSSFSRPITVWFPKKRFSVHLFGWFFLFTLLSLWTCVPVKMSNNQNRILLIDQQSKPNWNSHPYPNLLSIGITDQEKEDGISTLNMVIILVVIVKCVFICFALLAVCYR